MSNIEKKGLHSVKDRRGRSRKRGSTGLQGKQPNLGRPSGRATAAAHLPVAVVGKMYVRLMQLFRWKDGHYTCVVGPYVMKTNPAWYLRVNEPRMYDPTLLNTFNRMHNAWAFTQQGKEAYYRFLLKEWPYQPELTERVAAQLPSLVQPYSFVLDETLGSYILRISETFVIVAPRGWKPFRADSFYDPTRDNRFNREHNAWAFTPEGFVALRTYFRRSTHPKRAEILKILQKHPPLVEGDHERRHNTTHFGYDRRFRRYTMEMAPGYTIWATAKWRPRTKRMLFNPTMEGPFNRSKNSWVFTRRGADALRARITRELFKAAIPRYWRNTIQALSRLPVSVLADTTKVPVDGKFRRVGPGLVCKISKNYLITTKPGWSPLGRSDRFFNPTKRSWFNAVNNAWAFTRPGKKALLRAARRLGLWKVSYWADSARFRGRVLSHIRRSATTAPTKKDRRAWARSKDGKKTIRRLIKNLSQKERELLRTSLVRLAAGRSAVDLGGSPRKGRNLVVKPTGAQSFWQSAPRRLVKAMRRPVLGRALIRPKAKRFRKLDPRRTSTRRGPKLALRKRRKARFSTHLLKPLLLLSKTPGTGVLEGRGTAQLGGVELLRLNVDLFAAIRGRYYTKNISRQYRGLLGRHWLAYKKEHKRMMLFFNLRAGRGVRLDRDVKNHARLAPRRKFAVLGWRALKVFRGRPRRLGLLGRLPRPSTKSVSSSRGDLDYFAGGGFGGTTSPFIVKPSGQAPGPKLSTYFNLSVRGCGLRMFGGLWFYHKAGKKLKPRSYNSGLAGIRESSARRLFWSGALEGRAWTRSTRTKHLYIDHNGFKLKKHAANKYHVPLVARVRSKDLWWRGFEKTIRASTHRKKARGRGFVPSKNLRSGWAFLVADRWASLRLELPKSQVFQPLSPPALVMKLKPGAKVTVVLLGPQVQETYLLKGRKGARTLELSGQQRTTTRPFLETGLTLSCVLPSAVAGAFVEARPESRSRRYMRVAVRRHKGSSAIWPLSRSWDEGDARSLRTKGASRARKFRAFALRKHLLARADYWSRYRGKSYRFFRVLESQSRLSWGAATSNLHYQASGGEYWTRRMRTHDVNHTQQQVRAFKRYIKIYFKQMRRFPRRHDKQALRVHRTVFRAFFDKFLGFSEKTLLRLWARFRRGANRYWTGTGITNLVRRFTQSLLLSPQNLILLLRLAESAAGARAMLSAGVVAVNGQARTGLGYFFRPGDTLQILASSFKTFQDTVLWRQGSEPLKRRLSGIKFLQVDWSMLLFSMVYWPKGHELVAPSFLSERWVRFYVNFLPGKMAHRHKGWIKRVWMKHRPDPAPLTAAKPRKRMKPKPPRQGRPQTKYLYV